MPNRLVLPIVLVVLGGVLRAQAGPTHLVYAAEVRDGDRGQFHFSVEVTNPPADDLVFVIPHWAPGAYREITLAVRSGEPAWTALKGFAASDEAGKELPVSPDGDRRWRVHAPGARRVTFRYTSSAPGDRANNRSFLIENAGLIDGPRSWVYLEGRRDVPCHVHFRLPEGWRVGTGLDPTFDPYVFHADDYDRLADCPTAVGLFHDWTFQVRGVPHRILAMTAGREPGGDVVPFVDAVRRIVETYVTMFDDVPYQHYTFIYTPGSGGGLEHLTSTTIGAGNPARLNATALMSVTAHELFHAWNVKRLRPRALGPFDYSGPVRVKDLWIAEGITSYYTTVGLWRSNLTDQDQFLRAYAGSLQRWEASPVYRTVSPEAASLNVWDSNRSFRADYYLQGQVLGLLIDLAIRDATDNRKSFDDVMRRLYRTYGGYYRHQPPLPGYESEDVLKTAEAETGASLAAFWDRHVRGAEPIEWNRYFNVAGFHVDIEESPLPALAAHFRAAPGESGLRLLVSDGDPWSDAGFREGDVLQGLGDARVRRGREVQGILARASVGESLSVRILRDGKEEALTVPITPAHELYAIEVAPATPGVTVAELPFGLAVGAAGLKVGDRVVSVDGTAIENPEVWTTAIARLDAGSSVKLAVRRGDEQLEIDAPLPTLTRRRVRGVAAVENPTERQLAIRRGLHEGTTDAASGGASR